MSRHPVSAHAVGEVVGELLDRFGTHPDLAVVFVTAGHAGALEDVGATVRALLSPSVLLGVASGAVVGPGGDVDTGPGIALWCGLVGPVVPLLLSDAPVRAPFRPSAAVVLGDPTSPPGPGWGSWLAATVDRSRGGPHDGHGRLPLPVAGGTTSHAGLLLQDRLVTGSSVGALIGPAVRAQVVVSEGGRPIGDTMVVTSSDRSVVYELDGRPALERLMELVADRMPAADVHLVNDGLRLAILAQDGEPAGEHPAVTPELAAPALVVRGADRRNGALGVEGAVAPGSVVQFQVRDPRSASEAFERALAAAAPGGGAGALLFRSEARPAAWFGGLPSDATTVTDTLPTAALAGCATRTQVGPGAPGYHPIRDWATLLLVDDVQAG